jgi:hypothetical protein
LDFDQGLEFLIEYSVSLVVELSALTKIIKFSTSSYNCKILIEHYSTMQTLCGQETRIL